MEELPLKALTELKGITFHIPYQQRGYRWTPENVKELLDDFKDFIDSPNEKKRIYCLQPLAVIKLNDKTYSVLDGQQRLTTLFLLYYYLYQETPFQFEFERDENKERSDYLSNIATINESTANDNIDFFFIYAAYQQIKAWFACSEKVEKDFRHLLEASKEDKSVQVIWYEISKDKEYETFRSLNSGKIKLTNTELIKALLLNRVSGLPNREEAAAQFEHIEQEMANDHFWYIFNAEDVRPGETRMDMLFNLVAQCEQADYENDPRWSFRNYFDKPEKGSLTEKWQKVRYTFLRLKDMYDDVYCYHYIGFLSYCLGSNQLKIIRNYLKDYREKKHSEFKKKLKDDIKKNLVNKEHTSITEYNYYTSKKELRQLFLIHNIETILQRYEILKNNNQLQLQQNFEQFPFELLHKQSWDIEHIASNTDSDFRNEDDRKNWLNNIELDLRKEILDTDTEYKRLKQQYQRSKKKDDFDLLYKWIIQTYDSNSIKDCENVENGKMQIGNLTLLDSHTNRSYHNALFPRKRRCIIVAEGLEDKDDPQDTKIPKLFIPICTRQVFTKAYNKSESLTLNAWTQTDADAYVRDMEQKLSYYFEQSKENKQ